MYMLRGLDLEEPVLSSGYLCAFKDLHVKSILLDEIFRAPSAPDKVRIVSLYQFLWQSSLEVSIVHCNQPDFELKCPHI